MAISAGPEHITELLNRARSGDLTAESELAPMIYRELRRVAQSRMKRERSNHTLQVTELISEAYLKLMRPRDPSADLNWNDRRHFFAAAAGVMRNVLVDYARKKKSEKRGGGAVFVALDLVEPGVRQSYDKILDLHEALAQLAEVDERAARAIELRYFAGLSLEEIADCENLHTKTIQRDLEFAETWLYSRIAMSREEVPKRPAKNVSRSAGNSR